MITFTVQILNRLDQLGATDFDMIITDNDTVIPEFRVSKNYQIDPELIDANFLQVVASEQIEKIIAEWELVNGNINL